VSQAQFHAFTDTWSWADAAGTYHQFIDNCPNIAVVEIMHRGDVATLLGDVENQKAAGGVLITLDKPSKPIREEASDAGRYTSKLWHDKDYPRLQILTIEGLLNGTERIDAPPQLNPFAMAARESAPHTQTEMTIPSQG